MQVQTLNGQPTDQWSHFLQYRLHSSDKVFLFSCSVLLCHLFYSCFSTPTEVVLFSSRARITERNAQYGA